ncbi:MAG: SCP2 sterol-binding domain-containing protein [Candidatus Melainabacteria bacterium]|nr:SCP2 sterol-binding domain-containing protein [Candidatus Melainabacteria bacterium]
MAETCEESLKEMHKSFKPEVAGNLNATYLFDVSGANGGKWILEIKSGKCELKSGTHNSPTVTISISDQDWLAIHKGKLNSQMAFMMGKLRVSGDMGLAMKLQSMFPGQA